jgi:DnaJ-class molecular chaperone
VTRVQLSPLPEASDAFPDEVVISVLAKDYEPVKLPHRKIVAKLDAGVRGSSLAASFHGTTARMCEGCHHHAPAEEATASCRACHGEAAVASVDRPGLKVAYHRQCIGCHQAMGINKQGCTDCHALKEVES